MPDKNSEKRPVIPERQYAAVCRWVRENFIPIQSLNADRPLSRLSRAFIDGPNGFHVPDTVIRDAMVDCGYRAAKSRSGEWFFNISERSPAIQELVRRRREAMPQERRIRLYSASPWKY